MADEGRIIDIERDIELISSIPSVINILDVVCHSTGMGFAAVARVTQDRWVACASNDKIGFGLKAGGELKLETTICHEIRQHQQVVAIDHVAEDPYYATHHTPLMYGLQSYISIPIILKSGEFFGTLCAIDRIPASVNNEQTIRMFRLFSELIAFHLDSAKELSEANDKLIQEQANAEAREQFIAILGHDLKNPVGAISSAVQVLMRGNLDERGRKLASIIKDANHRSWGLINNILDFARGKFGSGIVLSYENELGLEETIVEVISEIQMVYPSRSINVDLAIAREVACDNKRIAQLFSNLLGNAITHGDSLAPVEISARTTGDNFELEITNQGNQITEETLAYLFKPFSRGKVNRNQEGLGLGLYIASEIAKAHGGDITVNSTSSETSFLVQIPLL